VLLENANNLLFRKPHPDLAIANASAPLGQYDDTKLLNLGYNRWSFKPELGISKAWGQWTFELAPSVTIFSDNKAASLALSASRGSIVGGY
jgi:hypothetical protein